MPDAEDWSFGGGGDLVQERLPELLYDGAGICFEKKNVQASADEAGPARFLLCSSSY